MNVPESGAQELVSVRGDDRAKRRARERDLITGCDTEVPGVRGRWLVWSPLAGLLLVILLARLAGWHAGPEWGLLVLACNFVFSTLASVFIAYLAGRSFLVRGAPGVLLIGCGVVAWGAAGVVANLTSHGEANLDVTIHNCGVWLSGLLHLTGAIMLWRPEYRVRTPGPWLAAGYIGALGAVVFGAIWAAQGEAPVFFIAGQGGTAVRQFVLGSAIAMFLLAAVLMMLSARGTRSAFPSWYVGALAAIAVGLAGILMQSTIGGLEAWAARAAIWLAGVYMTLAAVASAREASVWGIGLEEALRQSEGQLAADLDAMTRLQKMGAVFVRAGNLEAVLGETIETAMAITGADFGNIQLLDKDGKNLRIAAHRGFAQWWLDYWAEADAGNGTCGAALERGERVIVEDVKKSAIFAERAALEVQLNAGVRAVQSTPLMSRVGKLLGILSTHWKQPHRPDERVLRLVDLLARQTADMLERARNEEALRTSEQQFRWAIEEAPIPVIMHAEDGEVLQISRTWTELTGYTLKDVPTLEVWLDLAYGQGAEEVRDHLRGVFKNEQQRTIELEFPVRTRLGEVRHWSFSASSPGRLRDGRRFVVGMAVDITERKRADAVLARDKEELERLVAERTEKLRELVGELEHFSYTITHDMRAPLRAMRVFAEILKDGSKERLSEDEKGFVARIVTGAERMDGLITDALSYSKAVRSELPLGPVDVGRLVRGMLDTYPEFQGDHAEITIMGKLPIVMGNEAGLTQCFSNLLGNGVKFALPGARANVRIRSEAQEGWVRLWVEDDGIGISKEMLPRVFDMFAHGSSPQAGTGIGLALVRKVVDRMGGRVGVESELGKGSRFWVDLRAGDVKRAAAGIVGNGSSAS